MLSTRSRNKFCLSLDNSSSNTSTNTIHLNRWSEVVPPKTALTFAALWDPEEGMVTFSGAALLESESLSGLPPHPDVFDDDDHSQFITVDRETDVGASSGENTATLATFQDALKVFLHRTPWNSRDNLLVKPGQSARNCLQTRASSTFDGLDVYSHDVQLKPKRSLQLSCMDLLDMESSFRTPSAFGRLRLRSDLMLDSYRQDSESGSSSGSPPPNLKSRFSTTTTSTSNYVDVTNSALQSVRISQTSPTPTPDWPRSDSCASPAGSWPYLPRPRRVLRKRRPLTEGAATPTGSGSLPSTPRKLTPKASMSPSLTSPSPLTATVSSPSASSAIEEERRGRFPRPIGGRPITPATTPPNTPVKSPRLKLRFAFLPRRKPRQTSPDSEGWVCIEVTPIISQRYMADLDQD